MVSLLMITAAVFEFIFPVQAFKKWKMFVQSRFFPFYGLALIFGAYPFTQFKNISIGLLILIYGCVEMLLGVFTLIFPEFIREAFMSSASEISENDVKGMIRIDSFFRLSISALLLFVMYKYDGKIFF